MHELMLTEVFQTRELSVYTPSSDSFARGAILKMQEISVEPNPKVLFYLLALGGTSDPNARFKM
jgi:hypothetical protein